LKQTRRPTRFFGDSFRVHNRRLILRDKIATSDIERLANELGAASDADTLSLKPFVIRREAKAPILVRVLPISGPVRSAFVGARALLTFTELRPAGPDPTDISRVFGLTKAEARLASLIVAGLALDEAGRRLGISIITARQQLKAAFAKTGAHRQSTFVALLSRL
jgi:DNA-binding CsgD family transcriptional regulator